MNLNFTIAFVVLLISAGAVVLFLLDRTRATGLMLLGIVVIWLGFALALFGPQSVTQESQDKPGASIVIETSQPKAPVMWFFGLGSIVFAGGYLMHGFDAWKARRQSS